jgi:hypothetical protein
MQTKFAVAFRRSLTGAIESQRPVPSSAIWRQPLCHHGITILKIVGKGWMGVAVCDSGRHFIDGRLQKNGKAARLRC